ncbi:hypothetical protein [Paludibacterium paludis]|uniref:Uncharacterized protein n=1 Tax=Paludibacterium paludis TaxID=1225769 RepID=A0A918P5T6_9NEIS|nr:hypothetical protein [Paludibacterium paludis]GGY24958.1 hypothetical protein GCM10011289_30760 [Paludibacterium paludis]
MRRPPLPDADRCSLGPLTALLVALPLSVLLAVAEVGMGFLVFGVNVIEVGLRALSVEQTIAIAAGLLLTRHAVRRACLWAGLGRHVPKNAAMPVLACRLAALLPVVATGMIPAVAGFAKGSAALMAWSTLAIALSSPDLVSLWLLRRARRTDLVAPHPRRFGYRLATADPEAAAELTRQNTDHRQDG